MHQAQPGQPWQYEVTKAAETSPALLADRSGDSTNNRLREHQQKLTFPQNQMKQPLPSVTQYRV